MSGLLFSEGRTGEYECELFLTRRAARVVSWRPIVSASSGAVVAAVAAYMSDALRVSAQYWVVE